jgi:hypothetical protein
VVLLQAPGDHGGAQESSRLLLLEVSKWHSNEWLEQVLKNFSSQSAVARSALPESKYQQRVREIDERHNVIDPSWNINHSWRVEGGDQPRGRWVLFKKPEGPDRSGIRRVSATRTASRRGSNVTGVSEPSSGYSSGEASTPRRSYDSSLRESSKSDDCRSSETSASALQSQHMTPSELRQITTLKLHQIKGAWTEQVTAPFVRPLWVMSEKKESSMSPQGIEPPTTTSVYPLLPDLKGPHPSVKNDPNMQIEHWGLIDDPVRYSLTQVFADAKNWKRKDRLSDMILRNNTEDFFQSMQGILEMAVQILYAQIIWIQLRGVTDMVPPHEIFDDRFEFYEAPERDDMDSSSAEPSSYMSLWLSVGFGDRSPSRRPGVPALERDSHRSRDNSTAELGLTLWQLGALLRRNQEAPNQTQDRSKASVERPTFANAWHAIGEIVATCGHRYTGVVRACLRSTPDDELNTCREGLRELLAYRDDLRNTAVRQYAFLPFLRSSGNGLDCMVLKLPAQDERRPGVRFERRRARSF